MLVQAKSDWIPTLELLGQRQRQLLLEMSSVSHGVDLANSGLALSLRVMLASYTKPMREGSVFRCISTVHHRALIQVGKVCFLDSPAALVLLVWYLGKGA
jgi:hypothetical protein